MSEVMIPFVVLCMFSVGILVLTILLVSRSRIAVETYTSAKPEKDKKIRATQNTASWAELNGLDFLGFYTIHYNGRGFLAAWKFPEKPTYFCQYILGGGEYTVTGWDFTTHFENRVELSTCNRKDAHIQPKPPQEYFQSFSVSNFSELYEMHLAAEEYLVREGGARLMRSPIDFEELFVNALKQSNSWQWKHWYWVFFWLYFFFVRRLLWHNKTIRRQHELGMIQLPNEISLEASHNRA